MPKDDSQLRAFERLVAAALASTSIVPSARSSTLIDAAELVGRETGSIAPGERIRSDYERIDRTHEGGSDYKEMALIYLQCAFPYIPIIHLRLVLEHHKGHYTPTVLYLRTGQHPPGVNWGSYCTHRVDDDGSIHPASRITGYDDSYWKYRRALWDQGYKRKKTLFSARMRELRIKGRRDEVLEAERTWVEAQ